MTPDKVDRYEIVSAIGTGGMGRVYRARMQAPGGASKKVALKVMHDHLADDDDFVLLFLDEMRVAMGLSHRNIVQTFDAGKSDEGYFMVMELIEGCSLRRLLAARSSVNPVPLDVALFVAMEVSAALDYAHRFQPDGTLRAGVLHRDVSPGNVLLSAEGDVKLADFGVAKAAGGHHVTAAHAVPGKYQYMSPEQARGEPGVTSDLFSLGAVLYELATGAPMPRPSAFEGLQQTTLPAPPSSLQGALPPAFDALVLRCLDPDPAKRIGSASELRTKLSALSFDLQRAGGTRDPHARLRSFLADAGVLDLPAPSADQQAGRLAQAVLAQVRGIETDPSLHRPRLDSAALTVPLPSIPDETPAPTASAIPARSTGRRAAILVIVVLLAVAGAWAWSRIDSPEPSSAAPVPRGAPGSPTAASASSDAMATRTVRDDAAPADVVAAADAAADIVAAELSVVALKTAPGSPRHNRRVRYGLLDINSLPWAKVYVDGRYRGETPLQRLRLRAGLRSVRLVSPRGGLSKTYKVRVIAGKRRARVFDLSKD